MVLQTYRLVRDNSIWLDDIINKGVKMSTMKLHDSDRKVLIEIVRQLTTLNEQIEKLVMVVESLASELRTYVTSQTVG